MAYSLDIWYVALSSGPLPRLFKLCPGQYWPRPGVHLFYIDGYRKNFDRFLSETDLSVSLCPICIYYTKDAQHWLGYFAWCQMELYLTLDLV